MERLPPHALSLVCLLRRSSTCTVLAVLRESSETPKTLISTHLPIGTKSPNLLLHPPRLSGERPRSPSMHKTRIEQTGHTPPGYPPLPSDPGRNAVPRGPHQMQSNMHKARSPRPSPSPKANGHNNAQATKIAIVNRSALKDPVSLPGHTLPIQQAFTD
jgi:hypothetical protein